MAWHEPSTGRGFIGWQLFGVADDRYDFSDFGPRKAIVG
jgi:hypothetical protein